MSQVQTPSTLAYAELRQMMLTHPVLRSEVPSGHAVSQPLPTLRLGFAGFAAFAAPVDRTGGGLRQSLPDRWWVLDAATARLGLYATTAAQPLPLGMEAPGGVDVPPFGIGMAEFKARFDALDAILSSAAARFWAGQPAQRGAAVAEAIEAVVSPVLMPAHRALAPDFWVWLAA